MSNDFVGSTIRRLNLSMLFVSLAVLLVVFLGLVVGARYLYNMFLGPFATTQAEVLALNDADETLRYYINIEGDDHADTGFTYVSESDSGKETIEAYYHALVLGNEFLLVKTTQAEITNLQTGALIDIPTDVQNEVIAEIEREVPELKGAFLPMMLDTTNFHTNGLIGLGIGFVVAAIAGVGVLIAIVRFVNPSAHPAMKALARFGNPDMVVGQINMEMDSPHDQVGKKIHFTRGWLVNTTSGLQAAPYRDLMWCYKQITQHRTNGIPTGKSYAAYVLDKHGTQIILPGKEDQVNTMLDHIVRNAPGIVVGYSDELNTLWAKDRAGFVAAVEERRRNPPAA
jgi:hypothetical protein